MKKFILFLFVTCSLCTELHAEENAPETDINFSTEQYSAMMGQVDFAYPSDVTMHLSSSVLNGASQASLQVEWAESCTPINGSTGLSIRVKGFRNINEPADSLEISTDSLFFTTKIWLSLSANGQSVSAKQQYECDVLGTESWPVSINNAVVSKLKLSFAIAKPACSISTKNSLSLPPVSKYNQTSSTELPITVNCSNYASAPTVFLTLRGGQSSDGDSLYEDSNILIEALNDATGQRWKADGITKYVVGEVDTIKKVTPLISSSIKEDAHAGSYTTSATITLDVE